MAAFADELAPALSNTLQRVQAPPPPPPTGTFADGLAAFFGGGPDIDKAYASGLEARGKASAQSAQTLSALAEAEKRRQDAIGQSQINDAKAKAYADPNFQPSLPFYAMLAANANDLSNARLGTQEFGNRAILGDPNAAPAAAFAAGQGVQGKVLPHLYDVGGETVNQTLDPNATFETPAQKQHTAAEKALEGERNRSPLNTAVGGIKVPIGYQVAADGHSLEPVPGGPHDPNAAAPQGAREAVFTNRVLAGAAQATAAMQNVMRMPVGASTGTLGIGASPGHNIFESVKGMLVNKVAPEEVQQYSVALAGLSRNLASIETQGLSPPGSFIGSLDTLQLREGDSQLTKLVKLAEVRQTVEAGLDPLLNSPRVPPQTKQYAQALVAKLQQTIPFTWEDVQALNAAPEGQTLGALLKQKAAAGVPDAAPAAGGAVIQGTSKSGKPIVSHDGGATWEYQ